MFWEVHTALHNPTFIPYNDMATIIILFNPSKYPGNSLGLTWLLKSEKKIDCQNIPHTNTHKQIQNIKTNR